MLLQLTLLYTDIYDNSYNVIFKTKEKFYIVSGFAPTYPYWKKIWVRSWRYIKSYGEVEV
jgi:hypothetical protein